MPRQKPRYPLQLDNAFVDLCERYGIDAYSFECMLVAVAYLSPLGDDLDPIYRDPVSRMLQKMALKYPSVPDFTLAVQGSLPVD